MKSLQSQFDTIFLKLGGTLDHAKMLPSQVPVQADFQVNGALALSKSKGMKPHDLAKEVLSQIKTDEAEVSIAGPGFINIKLTPKTLLKNLSFKVKPEHKKVLIDYSSPNVAKGMHVGHLRSTLIGSALVNMYKEKGWEVLGDNHLGDWGTPMGIVMNMILKTPNFQWDLETIEKNYVEGSKLYQDKTQEQFKKEVQELTVKLQSKDAETLALWQKVVRTTINSLKEDYNALSISFDVWQGESFFEPLIPVMLKELEEKGFVKESMGAKVMELDKDTPPLILEKAGGGFLYHTTDLACVKYRQDFEKVLYVVDKRQNLHFKQVFDAAKIAGYNSASLEHITFGTINGADGRPYKTRQGEVLKLKELILQFKEKALEKMKDLGTDYSDEEKKTISDLVAVGSLKFSELKHHRDTDYVFDLDKFMSLEGFTGPYVMYSAVRAKSLLKKVDLEGKFHEHEFKPSERQLLMKIMLSSYAFEKALKLNQPHVLCEYVFDLAQCFSSFYNEVNVGKEKDSVLKAHYVAVVEEFYKTMEKVLSLLGIKLPEAM